MVVTSQIAPRWTFEPRPGWCLTRLARAAIPLIGVERIARRQPAPSSSDGVGPLVAAVAPRGGPAGVLDGDVVVKDQIDVAGWPTGIGLADGGAIAERDATVVARILAAGGRIIGKAKMTELGIDGIGTVMCYATPANPRAPGYAPGGSSTGTAVAVASGMARYGVGGDGLGSIRIPAAFCGLVGLKPSRDRTPRDGIRTPVRTLDAIGPIARSVDDCARLWQVMIGEPIAAIDAWVPDAVGVPLGALRPARVVAAAFDRALAALGVRRDRVELPELATATFLGGLIGAHELATGPYGDRATTRAGRISRRLGRAVSEADAAALYRQRDALREATARALADAPILALPTTAIPPPALAGRRGSAPDLVLMRALGAFTPLANLADLPSIAVPCGVDDRGRPLSIMFVARRGEETTLLRLAKAVEASGLAQQAV